METSQLTAVKVSPKFLNLHFLYDKESKSYFWGNFTNDLLNCDYYYYYTVSYYNCDS